MSWSEEEDAILARDFANTSSAELAERMGKSLGAVSSRACRLGLHKSQEHRSEVGKRGPLMRRGRERSTKEVIAELLAAKDMTMRELCKETGLSDKTVSAALSLMLADKEISADASHPKVYSADRPAPDLLDVGWLNPRAIPRGIARKPHVCMDVE